MSTTEETSPAALRRGRAAAQAVVADAREAGAVAAAPTGRRLRSGAVWVVAGRILGVGVTTMVNIVLARSLSPEDYGSYLLFSSVLGFASLMAMLGLGAALVRFVGENLGRDDVESARQSVRLVLAVAAVSIAAVAALGGWALDRYNVSTLELPAPGLVPLAVVSLVLLAMLQLLAEACRSLQDMRLATLFSGGQTGGLASNVLFLLLIMIALGLGSPNFTSALVLNALAMSVCVPAAVVGFVWAARRRLGPLAARPRQTKVSLRPLLNFSVAMLGVQLLTLFTTQADLWIAGVWCHHDQLALYGTARRLMLLVSLPVQMLNLTVVASIAELHVRQQRGELERLLRRAAALAALPSAAVIVVLILWGGPILELLFGPFFRQAALPVAILGLGQLFLVAVGSCGCALEMSGNHVVSLVVNLVAAVVLVVVGVWAANAYGILGLAVSSASIIAVQSVTLWLLARRIVGVWTHPTLRISPSWLVGLSS